MFRTFSAFKKSFDPLGISLLHTMMLLDTALGTSCKYHSICRISINGSVKVWISDQVNSNSIFSRYSEVSKTSLNEISAHLKRQKSTAVLRLVNTPIVSNLKNILPSRVSMNPSVL